MKIKHFRKMKFRFNYFIIILFVIFGNERLYATHNRAGEITYRQIGPLTVEMTITTYTKASSVAADRDSLDVNWGDGTMQFVRRNNSLTKFEPNDIKVNYYIATHTYPGVATYTISFLDPNRIGGILNVNYPNSIDIPFFLSTSFTLLDRQFQGYNNSAILLQPPIDIGCVNRLFVHNPNAYDADGDSLAFELTAPLQAVGLMVPGYKSPDEIGLSTNNSFTINPVTGEVRWNSPKIQGEYNIAIRIKEYRNGVLINVILRDMQILIKACENEPPTVKSIDEICVIAGEKVSIDLLVNDANIGQKVRLTATGGPFFITSSPAVLTGPRFFTAVPFTAKIEWQTNCNHVSNQYYQIVVRAVDNAERDSTGLAALKSIRIKVIAPPPLNLTSQTANGNILLQWDAPYACEVTDDRYFQGFSVWRKISSTNYKHDPCNPGLTRSPYQRIAARIVSQESGKYFFVDTGASSKNTYCYRVQAEFAKLTQTNNPFNRVEGLPSNESCQILLRDLPLITKVSVVTTAASQGQINVRFTKPLARQLDTLLNPGPYRYELLRSTDAINFASVTTLQTSTFAQSLDTNYFDMGINTLQNQFFYIIKFFANSREIGESPLASSVRLTAAPSDKKIVLNWSSETPWSNLRFEIYKRNLNNVFVRIGTSIIPEYEDLNLNNDSTYCYFVRTFGTYAINGLEDPIINDSQEKCLQPMDNVPSCAPKVTVSNVCDNPSGSIEIDQLYNTISWTNPILECPKIADDIAFYRIYFAPNDQDELVFLAEQPSSESLRFIHYPDDGLSGCYSVTSVDSLGNESTLSPKICADNCPSYELPNTFTPNGDGSNDLFKPRVNIFVDRIDLTVFNQWGNQVFRTVDPKILWDGTHNGKNLSDGTYYYTCRIFENRVTGVVERKEVLTGFINILRNN